MKHYLLFFVFLFGAAGQSTPAGRPGRAETSTALVRAPKGSLPIILTAPHGGRSSIAGVPARKGEGVQQFATVRDENTAELSLKIADFIEKDLGSRPYLIIADFERKQVDANRNRTAAFESPDAALHYDAFHEAVAAACAQIIKNSKSGLLVDIHGQSKERNAIFRGTGDRRTVRHLIDTWGESALTGPESISGVLATHQYSVIPASGSQDREDPAFNGGFIVRTYGSSPGRAMDALQLEIGTDLRANARLDRTARDIATSIVTFYKKYLDAAPAKKTQPDKLYHQYMKPFAPGIHWLEGGGGLWFSTKNGNDRLYTVVHADGRVRTAQSLSALQIQDQDWKPKPSPGVTRSRAGGGDITLTFHNHTKETLNMLWLDTTGNAVSYGEIPPGGRRGQQTFAGHAWRFETRSGDRSVVFVTNDAADEWGIEDAMLASPESRPMPVRKATDEGTFSVRDGNLYIKKSDGAVAQLSSGGSPGDSYQKPLYVSPDGRRAVALQIEPAQEHRIHLVQSSPADAVQPRLISRNYLKPGDRIARPRVRLFDLNRLVEIPVPEALFENAWSIEFIHAPAGGKEIFFLYNQRGHQVLRVIALDLESGAVRTVLEERSDTFIDYSQKLYVHWLQRSPAFLWASERCGTNHIYRVDPSSGAVAPVTLGPWNVRRVERVDEDGGDLWCIVLGVRPGEDPYHRHLARVNLQTGAMTLLTEADADHSFEFSPDRSLFLDRYSRVDLPQVTELRRAADGSLVARLGQADASELLQSGWRAPERFVAKGRDGKTDIHGILILPTGFDPQKNAGALLPVIEDIYAGPHDFHVPKQWGPGLRQRAIADLGFAVVQVDGMGTNWRTKAFHDVCWRNLKDGGFPDRIAWMKELARTRPYLDLSRVGIFGGSAGGHNALAALLHHGDFYKAAVSDCGCHDNRMDKIWWNEAWMGWPVGPWYAENSNVTHASKLKGKLMLTVGELDENVDPASTLQVVNALIEANLDFEFFMIPNGGHGVGESPYLVRRRQEFFVRWLTNGTTR